MKRLRLIHLLSALFIVLCAGAQSAVEEFAASLRPDKCAVYILDLQADTLVAYHNPSLPLIPASITKSLTIATTLSKSGKDFRYHTKVYATGPIHDGVLQGNLLIVGGGDPALGADVYPKDTDICAEIAAALKKHHVTSIEGKIITDSSIFPGPATHPTWGSGDLSHSYGTGCHGLNYRRNASGKSAVRNPQGVLVSAVTTALTREGITVVGEEMDTDDHRKELVDHKSAPISEIMRSCMMRSDNLYAEALLRTYAMLSKQEATTDNGARLEAEYWRRKGAPMENVTIVDGSGLSRSNRLTVQFLGYVLGKMSDNEEYASFFPLAGQEGTMKNMFKNTALDSYVALKTGTMRGVRCLAGYKLDEDFAPTHVIVIIANDAAAGTVNAAAQRMLLKIFYPTDTAENN